MIINLIKKAVCREIVYIESSVSFAKKVENLWLNVRLLGYSFTITLHVSLHDGNVNVSRVAVA